MTKILVHDLSKRYGYQWIIKNFEHNFDSTQIIGLSGANGSGKSTIIKMLSGFLSQTRGSINYIHLDREVSRENIFKFVSLVAPYTDLIQEFTLKEMFDFHSTFKTMDGISFEEFESKLALASTRDKTIGDFSSGMKQRLQLALALMSKSPYLFIDEPTSFLDSQAKRWFSSLLEEYQHDRCIVIASNDSFDLDLCASVISI